MDGFIEELPSQPMNQSDGAQNEFMSPDPVSNRVAIRLANEIISNPILTPLLMAAGKT